MEKQRKKCKIVYELLKKKIRICRICFKPIVLSSFRNLRAKNEYICDNCYENLSPKLLSFKVSKYRALAIYEYDDFIREKLYLLKGCFDIELAPIFLSDFGPILRLIYAGYYVVPVPSYIVEDEIREFNHVEEIFAPLKLTFMKIIKKTTRIKQSDQKVDKRKNIINFLEVKNGELITNKKILLVDDVYTTGSTIDACIKLLEPYKPKKISILVMSKVIMKD